jgi:hypothetical protein
MNGRINVLPDPYLHIGVPSSANDIIRGVNVAPRYELGFDTKSRKSGEIHPHA